MRRYVSLAILGALAGCGGARGSGGGGDRDRDPAPEPAADTPCGAMLAHLDTALGAGFAQRGEPVVFEEDGAITRAELAMRCASLSVWTVACLTLSSGAEVTSCGPGSEPTLLSTAGPSPYQKQKFEECVTAATTRAALDECSYYKPGPGREPLYPDPPPE